MNLDQAILFHAALGVLQSDYAERLVLLNPGSKAPASAGYMDRIVTQTRIRWEFRRRALNLGLKLGDGLGVIDCDGPGTREAAAELLGIDTTRGMISRTDKGVHVYVRTDLDRRIIKWRGHHFDILAKGFAVFPPSVVGGGMRREWESGMRPMAELPFLDASKLIEPVAEPRTAPALPPMTSTEAQRRSYMDRVPPSIQGNNGSGACIVACLKALTLTRGDADAAFALLRHWNARCVPPWNEEIDKGPDSLKRKLREARKFWDPSR